MTTNRTTNTPLKVDSYAGALILIDVLYDMRAISKATYENIKRNARNDIEK